MFPRLFCRIRIRPMTLDYSELLELPYKYNYDIEQSFGSAFFLSRSRSGPMHLVNHSSLNWRNSSIFIYSLIMKIDQIAVYRNKKDLPKKNLIYHNISSIMLLFWLLTPISSVAACGSAIRSRIWIQRENLTRIHEDPDSKHLSEATQKLYLV